MFTIEHEFDATVITLIDEAEPGTRPLHDDVTILAFDDRVIVEQTDPSGEIISQIVLSIQQLEELRAALNLPEGNYKMERP